MRVLMNVLMPVVSGYMSTNAVGLLMCDNRQQMTF